MITAVFLIVVGSLLLVYGAGGLVIGLVAAIVERCLFESWEEDEDHG